MQTFVERNLNTKEVITEDEAVRRYGMNMVGMKLYPVKEIEGYIQRYIENRYLR
jgi:hypothetical protein